MIAITTSSSIRVNAEAFALDREGEVGKEFITLLSADSIPVQAFSCLLGEESIGW